MNVCMCVCEWPFSNCKNVVFRMCKFRNPKQGRKEYAVVVVQTCLVYYTDLNHEICHPAHLLDICVLSRFAALYKKYCEEVYPARLVFVSFLRYQHAKGQMVTELQGLGYNPLQFCLEGSRPDLSKLDNLFGLLSSDSATFDDELTATEKRIKEEGIAAVYSSLKKELKEQAES